MAAKGGGESEEAPTSEEEEEDDEEDESAGGWEHTSAEKIEPRHVWIERVTRMGLKEMQKAHVEDWVVAAKRSIWTLAGHISRREDGRWSTAIFDWSPGSGRRKRAHPLKRWSDDIDAHIEKTYEKKEPAYWRLLAEERPEWKIAGEVCAAEHGRNAGA